MVSKLEQEQQTKRFTEEKKPKHFCCDPSQSLRKALRIMGAPNLLADNMEYGLSYSVVSYLKKLSQQVGGFLALQLLYMQHATNSVVSGV